MLISIFVNLNMERWSKWLQWNKKVERAQNLTIKINIRVMFSGHNYTKMERKFSSMLSVSLHLLTICTMELRSVSWRVDNFERSDSPPRIWMNHRTIQPQGFCFPLCFERIARCGTFGQDRQLDVHCKPKECESLAHNCGFRSVARGPGWTST